MKNDKLRKLKSEVKSELVDNILPFWSKRMVDTDFGGFFGRIDGNGSIHMDAGKGAVLNSRILWTFSSSYRVLQDPGYLETAERAKEYLVKCFFDKQYGGVFWLLDHKGNMKDGKKQIYAQAFAIYALTEFYRVTNDRDSLDKAIDLFRLIEKHSYDERMDGYYEAFSREWGIIDDLRLSDRDENEKKTMNTHLHILEAYTNLYRVWKDDFLKERLKGLIMIFLEKIVNRQTFNLNMFFDEDWNDKTSVISYGHNIESSWLIYEAAHVLSDESVIRASGDVCLKIAESSKEGIMPDGSMIYEKSLSTGHIDYDRHWWVQAEAVIGFLNSWSITGNEEFLDMSLSSWLFIYDHLIDRKNGEWFWSVDRNLVPDLEEDKAGFWKCPYHNARMCLEIIER